MRLCWLLITLAAVALSTEIRAEERKPIAMRAQVTVENWDKGGPLSHWVYTHISEVFPAAVVRRGGAIMELPAQLRPEVGSLKLKKDDGSEQTLGNYESIEAAIIRDQLFLTFASDTVGDAKGRAINNRAINNP